MKASSKEAYKKVKTLKAELSQTKTRYHNLIYSLKQRESLARQFKSVAIGSKTSAMREQKLQDIRNRIKSLERERDEKIGKLEKELATIKDDYRDNYEKYKEEDKKVRRNKIDNKKQDIKIFFDRNKLKLIIAAIILLVIAGVNIVKSIRRGIEEGRNYYINIDESYVFDCNARYDGGFSAYCEDRFISGEFSNYDTVEFNWIFSIDINGNKFTKKLYDYIDPSYFQKSDFNIEDLRKGIDKKYSFDLENKILGKIVASKDVKIHYNLSEADLDLVTQLHNKWVADEAEKAAKAQKEAEERAQREAEEKARREAEEKAAKEAQAQKEAEEKAAREKAAQEEAARKAAEEEARKSYKIKIINDGENCPANAQYCYISGNSSGYTSYGYGYFRGKIINNTGRNLNYIQVTVDIYNSANSKVGDCWGNLGGLAAGATWEFEAYCTAWPNGASLKNIDITAY